MITVDDPLTLLEIGCACDLMTVCYDKLDRDVISTTCGIIPATFIKVVAFFLCKAGFKNVFCGVSHIRLSEQHVC